MAKHKHRQAFNLWATPGSDLHVALGSVARRAARLAEIQSARKHFLERLEQYPGSLLEGLEAFTGDILVSYGTSSQADYKDRTNRWSVA